MLKNPYVMRGCFAFVFALGFFSFESCVLPVLMRIWRLVKGRFTRSVHLQAHCAPGAFRLVLRVQPGQPHQVGVSSIAPNINAILRIRPICRA